MRTVDTNVLARFYLRDDAVQGRVAASLLAAGDVFIPKTVILELEWVLRYVADQPSSKVIDCLAHLIALPGITVENRDQIEAALGYARNGMVVPALRCLLVLLHYGSCALPGPRASRECRRNSPAR